METLGTGQFITSDWRRTWYTYQSNPDLIDPATGYASYEITDIEGTLPKDLVGDLYRNGPGNFGFNDERVQHVLDADGLVFKISFPPPATDGKQKIHFTSRFVETKAFREELAAGEFLYRGTFGTGRRGHLLNLFQDKDARQGLNADPPVVPLLSKVLGNALKTNIKNTANTHVVSFGGKVLALYEAGLPHALDPVTLETLGEDDMGGMLPKGKLAVKSAMIPEAFAPDFLGGAAHTAHPKQCPRTGHLVGWHWSQVVPGALLEVTLTEWSPDGFQPVASKTYRLPNVELAPHDMALTENCVIMLMNALSMNQLPFLAGVKGPAESLSMDGRANITAVVMPRPTSSHQFEPYSISVPPAFCIHFSHGYEDRETGNLVSFFSGWPPSDSKDFLGAWGGFCPDFAVIPPTFLWRMELDPVTRTCVNLGIAPGSQNVCVEHVVVHPDFQTRPAKHVYGVASNVVGDSSAPTGYVKLPVEDGSTRVLEEGERNTKVDAWWFGTRVFAEEPQVVPKLNGDPNDEDDAYLLGMIFDAVKDKSGLAIFDLKRDLKEGPICVLWLKSAIPHGLHGCFARDGGGSSSVFC